MFLQPSKLPARALAGMALSFFYVLPVTLGFFMSFQSGSVQIMQTVDQYVSFVISMCLAFGAIFELPIVIALLSAMGSSSRALGLGHTLPDAAITLGSHHLLLRSVDKHSGMALITVR